MEEPFWYSLALIIFNLLLKLSIAKITQKHNNFPPSPPSLPIIGYLHLLKQPIHRTLQALSGKFGKLLLLRWGSRGVLLVSSPSLAEELFTKHDIIFANRPRLLIGKHLAYDFTTVSLAPYGDLWRNLRRIMTLELFSASRLAQFSSIRQGEVRLLLNEIMKKSCTERKTKIELESKFTELSFNVMTMMVVGKRFYGENVLDVEEAKNIQKVIRDGMDISGAANLGDFFPFLQWIDISGIEKKMCGSNGKEVKKLMIDNLLALQETEPQFYTEEIIKGIILVMLVAGTNTSSTTLDWAMALLINHPETMENVKAEIEAKIGQERLLEEQDLPKLTYLQNAINETLRLYPPSPLLFPHEAYEDCVVGGFDVPRHTMLFINAWGIHRDPNTGPVRYKWFPLGKCMFIATSSHIDKKRVKRMEEPFWYGLALIIFTLLLKLSTTRQKHKKNLPPSPPSLPMIGHLHLVKQPIRRTLQALAQKFCKVLRLRWGSRRVLLVSSPSVAEELFTKHDIIFASRPRLLVGKHFAYDFTTVTLAPYGDLWRNLRRVMTLEVFSSARLAQFSSIRQGEVRLLLNQTMKSCAKSMTKVELKSKFTELSFNVMTMMAVGKSSGGSSHGLAGLMPDPKF
ncbi:unnamed protein product [Prunus armeniaca]|uniref:Cytochrome P450 n=1 Tax=Prunus armeniaca TaxID=36596 RepID=A0A6J5TQD4_PRUAR|nr:unnamed protein product [Prunus armeniaca]